MTPTTHSTVPGSMLALKAALFATPMILLSLYLYGSTKVFEYNTRERDAVQKEVEIDGAKLYNLNCAQCHGVQGDGKGIALLYSPARHFGFEKFRFSSTDNGIPTDDDLIHLLKNGIEGSSMPAFKLLKHEEYLAIIGYVRQLARRGLFERLLKEAKAKEEEGGDEVNLTQIAASVEKRIQIGKPLAIPTSFPEATTHSKTNGKRVFQTACASCHGPEGRGDGPQTKDPKFVNENGTKAIPRDLTAGIYKAGGEHAKLYARVMLGIPGTPMPASNSLPTTDVLDLVNYLRSLPSESPAKSKAP